MLDESNELRPHKNLSVGWALMLSACEGMGRLREDKKHTQNYFLFNAITNPQATLSFSKAVSDLGTWLTEYL